MPIFCKMQFYENWKCSSFGKGYKPFYSHNMQESESLLNQGTPTEGEGSVQLTSSLGYIALQKDQMMFALSRTKEVNCTEISPSIRVPWFNHGALW